MKCGEGLFLFEPCGRVHLLPRALTNPVSLDSPATRTTRSAQRPKAPTAAGAFGIGRLGSAFFGSGVVHQEEAEHGEGALALVPPHDVTGLLVIIRGVRGL